MLHFAARFCSFLFSFAFLLLVVSFVLSNRDAVDVALFPLPYTISAPIYIIVLIILVIGWISGMSIGRMGTNKARSALKREMRRAELLDNEIKALHIKQHQETHNAPQLKPKT